MTVGSLRPDRHVTSDECRKCTRRNDGICRHCRHYYESSKPDSVTETYTMTFTCYNCKTSFDHEVPLGERAHNRGGMCPYCHVNDYDAYKGYNSFTFCKPHKEIEEGDY